MFLGTHGARLSISADGFLQGVPDTFGPVSVGGLWERSQQSTKSKPQKADLALVTSL